MEIDSQDETAWRQALARRIRGELAEHEKTQDDAAFVLGLSQAAVNRRLRGHVEWSAVELRRLALWLGVPLRSLLPQVDSNHQPADGWLCPDQSAFVLASAA